MKQIKAFVHRNRVSDLIHELAAAGFQRLTLFEVKGLMRALNAREQQFSVEFGGQMISEMQMEVFCEDVDLPKALEIFQRTGRTGRADSGWLYVSTVESAIAIGDAGEAS